MQNRVTQKTLVYALETYQGNREIRLGLKDISIAASRLTNGSHTNHRGDTITKLRLPEPLSAYVRYCGELYRYAGFSLNGYGQPVLPVRFVLQGNGFSRIVAPVEIWSWLMEQKKPRKAGGF